MEDFQELNIFHLKVDKEIFDQIKEHCLRDKIYESCGIVYGHKELKFLPCENKSLINKIIHFAICPSYIINYDVKYIVHSHVIASAEPSELDKRKSKEQGIPFIIYSLRDDDFCIYENIGV